MSDRYAFVDESYIVASRYYLLVAVVVREDMLDDVRAPVRAVRRRRRDAFHWHGEFDRSRSAMLELIAATSDLQIVVVSRPVPPRPQERAWARCTESLLAPLQFLDPPVRDVILESRIHVLDRRRDPHRRPPSIDADRTRAPVLLRDHGRATALDR